MKTTAEEFAKLLDEPESPNLEFKEARDSFKFGTLANYCVAIANEGGGKIVLGVTDKRPREVVGTNAFLNFGTIQNDLHNELNHRVPIEAYTHEGKRVLIVHVAGKEDGGLWMRQGTAYKREGEALVPMVYADIQRIFARETPSDYSAQICEATLDDLSLEAIADFQQRWVDKSGKSHIARFSHEQILRDTGLVVDGKVSHAALILFGVRKALKRYLPHAEVFFEYRSSLASKPAQERRDFNEGLLLHFDKIWEKVNQRNGQQSYQDKFYMPTVPTFDEKSIREALLNAVTHRDYREAAAIHIRQFPEHIEIDSPGGFLMGVTSDNVIDQCKRRNPLLAECFQHAGLVERAGQGVDAMIATAIHHGKPLPDFSRSTEGDVRLTLDGTIENPTLALLMQKLDQETVLELSSHSLMALHAIANRHPLNGLTKTGLPELLDAGIVERHGKGRGTYYVITRARYEEIGLPHRYENQLRPSNEDYKTQIMEYLRDRGEDGASTAELMRAMPELTRNKIMAILRSLRDDDGLIRNFGVGRGTHWVALESVNLLPEFD